MVLRSRFLPLLLFIISCCALRAEPAKIKDSRIVKGSYEITNLKQIATSLKISAFKGKTFGKKIRIAVFDNGFYGYEDQVGKTLPQGTICYANGEKLSEECKDEPGYKPTPEEIKAGKERPTHGLLMAEIIAQILKEAGNDNYEIMLLRVAGLDRLRLAVSRAILDRFDIVLYSDVWEFGGNGDGKGFVNAQVNEALRAGIIWINAVGNFGRSMRQGAVEGSDNWMLFKNSKGEKEFRVELRCVLNRACELRLVLAWNDFKDDSELGSDKQINLYLYDASGKEVAKSEKIQMLHPPPKDPAYTSLPRQMIKYDLAPGTPKKPLKYTAKALIVTKNFNAATDKFWMAASGLGVQIQYPQVGETILPPADNPGVIVVGASDDPQSSASDSRGLPKILLRSAVDLKSGLHPYESSTAAAMAAAMSALYLSTGTDKTREAVEKKLLAITQKAEFKILDVEKKKPESKQKAEPAPAMTERELKRAIELENKPATKRSLREPEPEEAAPRQRKFRRVARGGGSSGGSSPPGVCIGQIRLPQNYPWVERLLGDGRAVAVSSQGQPIILVNFDFEREFRLKRTTRNQRPYITPDGPALVDPRRGLPEGFYEITSDDVTICEN